MANSDFDIDDESKCEVNFHDMNNKIHAYSKKKSISLSNILIDAYQKIFVEKDQFMNDYASLRFENKDLEVSKENMKILLLIWRTGFLYKGLKIQP